MNVSLEQRTCWSSFRLWQSVQIYLRQTQKSKFQTCCGGFSEIWSGYWWPPSQVLSAYIEGDNKYIPEKKSCLLKAIDHVRESQPMVFDCEMWKQRVLLRAMKQLLLNVMGADVFLDWKMLNTSADIKCVQYFVLYLCEIDFEMMGWISCLWAMTAFSLI